MTTDPLTVLLGTEEQICYW